MATTFNIPTADGTVFSRYEIEVELDGVVYRMDFRYNGRQQSWFMELADGVGDVIRSGIRIVSSFPLTQRLASRNRPDGTLLGVITIGDEIDFPDLEQLGNEVTLTYTGES